MRTLALLFAIVVGSILPAAAEDNLTPGQTVIRSQEEAFGRDDAAAAYTFAASAVKSIFPTPDIFMSMVRSGYAPVYRHRSFEFGEAATYEGKLYQQVHIIDANGDAWEALYTLEPQEDGTFKISGCVLKKAVTS